MSAPPAPPAPLEAHDPERARSLKAKIRDRVADLRRHLIALRTAMAEFGLELAEVRSRDADLNGRRDLQVLLRIGVLGPKRARRLERLRELRRLLVHE